MNVLSPASCRGAATEHVEPELRRSGALARCGSRWSYGSGGCAGRGNTFGSAGAVGARLDRVGSAASSSATALVELRASTARASTAKPCRSPAPDRSTRQEDHSGQSRSTVSPQRDRCTDRSTGLGPRQQPVAEKPGNTASSRIHNQPCVGGRRPWLSNNSTSGPSSTAALRFIAVMYSSVPMPRRARFVMNR